MNNSIQKAMVDIINLKDETVRRALIDLGWTPPEEKKDSAANNNNRWFFANKPGNPEQKA